jgi:hypothetical protein
MLGAAPFIKLLAVALIGSVCVVAAQEVLSPLTPESVCANETVRAQIFKREAQVDAIIAGNTATVNSEIQVFRDPFLLVFHPTRLHFSDQVDFSQRSQANPRARGERTGHFLWKFDPAGFADRACLDQGRFTQDNYQLNPRDFGSCQDQTCCVYEVTPVQSARSHQVVPFFRGTIWVETAEYTVIRFKGQDVPANSVHFPLTVDDWFEFDSWRIKVAPHLWLPDHVTSRNTGKDRDSFFPKFESETIFSDFKPR